MAEMGLSQPTHVIALLLLILLLFGAKRLPEMGRSLGLGMREFKDSVSSIGDAENADSEVESRPLPKASTTQAAFDHERRTT
jgi:sec-independent protein translocase protein TatA